MSDEHIYLSDFINIFPLYSSQKQDALLSLLLNLTLERTRETV